MSKVIRQFSKLIIAFLFIQCTPAPKVAGQFTDVEFTEMADKMAKGSVPDISIQELIADPNQYLLLDTRALEEYEVSHLPNAQWAGFDEFNIQSWEHLPKDQPIVTYCSVGYRSERIGEKLQKAGFTKVYNLHGSLFAWSNQNLPMEDVDGKATTQVHGYNQKWSKWIKNGTVVY